MEQHSSGLGAQELRTGRGSPRAAPSRSRRRLRVALVRAGRILEERVLPRRATLTLGPSELHTFVIAASELAFAIELIRFTSKGRALIVPRGATGAVSTATEKITLGAALEGHIIALDEESRGRIALGDLTVLFQLTEPPPRRPRAGLPVSLRSGVEIDWATTVIAAFSFLFHFGMVGSIYSDWLDPLVDDRIVIGEVVESLSSLPSTPRVEEPTPESVATRPAPAPIRTRERSVPSRSQPRADAHRTGTSSEPVGDARAASLANQLNAIS